MALKVIDICEDINNNLPDDSPYKNLNLRSDLYLTAISKLINVILAYAINKPEYIRSINKLLKIAA